MIGTRVNGVVAAELRDIQGGPAGSGGRWGKVLGLAGKVGAAFLSWEGNQANVNSGRIMCHMEVGESIPQQRGRETSGGEDDHPFERTRAREDELYLVVPSRCISTLSTETEKGQTQE